jgi:CPA2 family monovalent cation:H+ antiporter-2
MEAFALLQDLAAVLGAAIVMGLVFYRLRQPVIIGYLIGGMLVGPHALQFVSDAHFIETLAEIGVILLMFALGLELTFSELKPVRTVAIGGGILQLLITIGLLTGVGSLLGMSLGSGILLGCIIALSSTVIALKVLMERGEIDSMHGRIALGLLIVQDLSVVPMMVMLPNLQDPGQILGWPIVMAMGKAALVLGVMGFLGLRFLPPIMHRVATTRNKELFLLAGIAVCFGTAALTYSFGLSLALGAFLAGIVISESDHSHQVLADVLPLRDLFATVFFTSVGMLIDPVVLLHHLPAVAAVVMAVVLGKAVLIAGLTKAFGYAGRTALAVGMSLAQIGEFSIVLGKMGQQAGIISADTLAVILGSTLLSIVATPAMMQASVPLYRRLSRWLGRTAQPLERSPGRATGHLDGLVDHVVLCGFGRVGSNLGEVLIKHQIPVLVIDIDQNVIQRLRDKGIPCLYGDSSNLEVLRHASLPLARAVVIALPDPMSCRLALEYAKELNPAVDVLVRAHRTDDVALLYANGADQVIQPEFEASIEAIRYTLTKLGHSAREVHLYASRIRRARYRQFIDDFQPEAVPDPVDALSDQDLHWIDVAADSAVTGQSLKEAAIRSRTGAAVLAVRRAGTLLANPNPDLVLTAGDTVLVMGESPQLDRLTELLRSAAG